MALDFKYLTPDQQLTALFKSIGIPERRKVKVKIDFDLIEAKRLYHAWFLAGNPKLKNPNSEGPYIMMTEDSCEILRKLKTAINTAINIEEQKMSNEKLENEPDIEKIKKMGNNFHGYLESFPNNRELSLAKTRLEECVMWAVKGISA